jgi:hypothetical protein
MAQPDQDDVPPQLVAAVETMSIRDQVLDALLDKVDGDRYPSSGMLDDIESLLTTGRKQDYADVLLAKIRADRFPSRSLIQRVVRLSG